MTRTSWSVCHLTDFQNTNHSSSLALFSQILATVQTFLVPVICPITPGLGIILITYTWWAPSFT